MTIDKATALSVLRNILTVIGTYMVGLNLFGQPADQTLITELIGAFMTVIGIGWGILDKSATVDAVESGLRSVISVVGGLLVSWGKLGANNLAAMTGLITVLVPVLLSYTSKAKGKQIVAGKISVDPKSGKMLKVA